MLSLFQPHTLLPSETAIQFLFQYQEHRVPFPCPSPSAQHTSLQHRTSHSATQHTLRTHCKGQYYNTLCAKGNTITHYIIQHICTHTCTYIMHMYMHIRILMIHHEMLYITIYSQTIIHNYVRTLQ